MSDKIVSRPSNEQYREEFDRIFRREARKNPKPPEKAVTPKQTRKDDKNVG